MPVSLRSDSAQRLSCWLESTAGFPARDLLQKRWTAAHLHIQPAELLTAEDLTADSLIACRAASAANLPALSRLLPSRAPRLLPSAYRIQFVRTGRRRHLLVLGGDLFGMLAGLADVLQRSALNAHGLTYSGGDRTETPAFPLRYYWTWDLSTNWMLDDPGIQVVGCNNRYCKRPETFLEDYRRLIDHCVETRFNGLVIWGFLRDSHGGEAYAGEVARYAAERGVALLPGVGTTGYGGIYYEGRHPCNLETFLAAHPHLGNLHPGNVRSHDMLSPYHRQSQQWIARSLRWLYETFPIAGVNLENGDLLVDHSSAARRARARLKTSEADFLKDQYFAYRTALDVAHRLAPQAWNTYATYCGFGRGQHVDNQSADMGHVPYFAKHMPASAIAQWTLTGMLRRMPVPLRDWLRDAAPAAAYDNDRWPRRLRPPTPRSAGYIHHGSAYHPTVRRSSPCLSTFAEACLRSAEAGLEGISIYGEVTSRTLAWNLNYLVMRHWTYHPHSTLAEFAAAELAPRLGGTQAASDFVECLCLLDERKAREASEMSKVYRDRNVPRNSSDDGNHEIARLWQQIREWSILQQHPAWAAGFTDML